MKQLKYSSFLFVVALFTCNLMVAQGNGNHNWKFSNKFISVGEVYVSLDGEPYLGDQFPVGGTAKFVFDQISGYSSRGGKVYPQLTMRVLENNPSRRVVLEYGNLLEEYQYSGLEQSVASQLSASLTIGDPLLVGGKYICEINITETNGKGKVHLAYQFEVSGSGHGAPPVSANNNPFLYDTKDLNLEEVILEINGQPYGDTDLPVQQTVDMVFKGLNGFSAVGGRVYPGMAIRVTDQSGNVVLNEGDLLAAYDQSGITLQQAQRLVSSLTIGNPMQLGKTYKWEVRIWDKKWTGKTVDAALNFRVIQ